MTSSFDPTQFLDATTTEAASRRLPIPAGDYPGVIGEPNVRANVQGKKDPSKSYNFIDFPITVDLTSSPRARDLVGQDSVKLTYGVSLDTNATGLDWSPGKNTGLRFMREATNNNTAGKSFSIRSLEGCMVKVKIAHREYPEGSGEMQDYVAAVSKP